MEQPRPDYGALNDALCSALAVDHLQPVPWFLDKCIQIYDMILLRHGLMIVGEPLGAKTTAFKTLATALGDLEKQGVMNERKVQYSIINPKAITMGQLYGCFDQVSHEWTDGKNSVPSTRYN